MVFPLGVWVLIRINREYRREAAALERLPAGARDRPRTRRHRVFVLVETLDLAALKALGMPTSCGPTT
ncbi:APC family permease OS=Streptomyces tendae OX=1932 GN=GUR47_06865 PE=4 SV=1 [Streptomyces tendae]